MEYLRIHPNKFTYRIVKEINTEHDFTCLHILKKYMEINVYYEYLSSLKENSLNNIWNFIVKRWLTTRKECEISHPKSKYAKQVYEYEHSQMIHFELDHKLREFVGNDKVKALYIVKSLQRYLFP